METLPPLKLIGLLTSQKGAALTRTNLSAPWSEIIPLWLYSMVVSSWHRFSVAANVTFITSFLSYACVSSDLQRRREGERGALWFGSSFTSGALSLRQAVLCLSPPDMFYLFIYLFAFPTILHSRLPGRFAVRRAQFCRGSAMQTYFHCMHSASVNTFCRRLHITLPKLAADLVTAVLPDLFWTRTAIQLHACLGLPISIVDRGVSHFNTNLENFN